MYGSPFGSGKNGEGRMDPYGKNENMPTFEFLLGGVNNTPDGKKMEDILKQIPLQVIQFVTF